MSFCWPLCSHRTRVNITTEHQNWRWLSKNKSTTVRFFRGHLCVFFRYCFLSLCSFKVFLRRYFFVDWFDVSRLKYFLVRELQIGFFISFPFGLDRFSDGFHDLSVALPSDARKMYLWCKKDTKKAWTRLFKQCFWIRHTDT